MVQKGKLAACASDLRASALKSVDLPTFGSPMMPTRTFITRAPPLLRGRRQAAPRGALVSARARPRASATVSIKHANLKLLSMLVAAATSRVLGLPRPPADGRVLNFRQEGAG